VRRLAREDRSDARVLFTAETAQPHSETWHP
jgi:hypothetical protein